MKLENIGNYLQTKLENLGNDKDKYYTDENAFVFSLNNNKIYKILRPEYAIRFYNQNCPILTGNNSKGNGFYYSGDIFFDMTSLREGVTVFKYPYLSAGAPSLGEDKRVNELEIFEIC